MQLKDIVKTLDQMSDEELLERLRQTRHRRTVERPAQKAIIERVERKQTRQKMSALDKLLAGLSEEDRARLLEQLTNEGSNNDGGSQGGTG